MDVSLVPRIGYMKPQYLCRIGLLAGVLALSACGGGSGSSTADSSSSSGSSSGSSGSSSSSSGSSSSGSTTTYTAGYNVTGLATSTSVGLQITVNGSSAGSATASTNGGGVFAAVALQAADQYAITVVTQPSGQYCTVSGGSGSSVSANVTATISCSTTASIAGLWSGTAGTDTLTGMSDGNGQFYVHDLDTATNLDAVYAGTVTVTRTGVDTGTLSGSYTGATLGTTTFADGSTSETGTVAGTLTARSSIDATGSYTTVRGGTGTTRLYMTYDAAGYESPSSLAMLGGTSGITYTGTDGSGSIQLTVAADGSLSGSDTTLGCDDITGQASLIDATRNLYNVTLAFAGTGTGGSCTPLVGAADLSGVTTTGLATLRASTPAAWVIAAKGTSAGTTYIVYYVLNP